MRTRPVAVSQTDASGLGAHPPLDDKSHPQIFVLVHDDDSTTVLSYLPQDSNDSVIFYPIPPNQTFTKLIRPCAPMKCCSFELSGLTCPEGFLRNGILNLPVATPPAHLDDYVVIECSERCKTDDELSVLGTSRYEHLNMLVAEVRESMIQDMKARSIPSRHMFPRDPTTGAYDPITTLQFTDALLPSLRAGHDLLAVLRLSPDGAFVPKTSSTICLHYDSIPASIPLLGLDQYLDPAHGATTRLLDHFYLASNVRFSFKSYGDECNTVELYSRETFQPASCHRTSSSNTISQLAVNMLWFQEDCELKVLANLAHFCRSSHLPPFDATLLYTNDLIELKLVQTFTTCLLHTPLLRSLTPFFRIRMGNRRLENIWTVSGQSERRVDSVMKRLDAITNANKSSEAAGSAGDAAASSSTVRRR